MTATARVAVDVGQAGRRRRAATGEQFPARYLAAHIALGLAAAHSSLLISIYGALTILVALWWAWASTDLTRVAAVAGYVACSDVLWRSTNAHLPWEAGKYALIAVCLIAVVRSVRQLRESLLPLLFLGLLIPSSMLTIAIDGVRGSRQDLSFNLAGPVSLAVAALFFLQLRADWLSVRRILWGMVGPCVAMAAVATTGIVSAAALRFNDESNFQTSGGYGPNQVSNALSVGALACLLLVLNDRRVLVRLGEAVVAVALFGQSILTFSRGGGFSLAIAGGLGVLVVAAQGRGRARTAFVALVIVVLGLVVFSNLNGFTNGALDKRFHDTSTTGRSNIAKQDLNIWTHHRFAGVGPGMAPRYREDVTARMHKLPAHTEFTRLLSEHGTLGLMAILLLVLMAARAVIRAPGAWQRALAVALPTWSLVTMSHSAMRIASISFVFGLGMMQFHREHVRSEEA